jgi:hypothetical protein
LRSAELYYPGTGSWTPIPLIVTRGLVQSATALPDGTELVTTGFIEAVVPTSADLYDPGTGH